MPRPPGSDPETPIYKCPQCGQVLTFHNARVEGTATDRPTLTNVYFCMTHGFFRVTDSQPLAPGM